VLYSFPANGSHGFNPVASLIFDAAGNVYSTTHVGGNPSCRGGCGTVFKLAPNSDGTWTERVLHSFASHPAANPEAGLIFDATGNLYGTAFTGGPTNGGAVFKLAPQSNGSWAYSVLHLFQGNPLEIQLVVWSSTKLAISTARPRCAPPAQAVTVSSLRSARSFELCRQSQKAESPSAAPASTCVATVGLNEFLLRCSHDLVL